MAILQDTEILEILKVPRNPYIGEWKEEHDRLSIYVKGGDVATELEKVKNYENESQYQLRKDIAKSTKDKVSDLLKPLSKVFNSSGGSVTIDDLNETQKESFKKLMDTLPEGMSISEWVESYLVEGMVVDPNGVVFIETGAKSTDSEGLAYPTYKSINTIHDYQMTWNKFEYIVFLYMTAMVGKEEKQIYRVFDDEKDGLYYVENDELKEYEEDGIQSIINHDFGYVPAVVCGSIVDKKTKGKLSFLHNIDESLEEYLRASSVFVIYKFLHLFPRFWQYAMKCVTCEGTGQIIDIHSDDTPKAKKTCPTCKGKRLKVSTDVSDAITLPIPKNDQPVLGGNMAGFIDTPIAAWDQMNEDLLNQEKAMEYSLWGSYLTDRDDTKERTATESHINVQPINEMLCGVSRWIETKESQILTFMARIMTQSDKAVIDVKYGKRFIIESPDALWNKYLDAKSKQAPITTLDYHYDQYLMSEYQNDQVMYNIRKKMLMIEPFAHYSLSDIENVATAEQKQKKLYFSQWVNTGINWETDAIKLSSEFDTYFTTNVPRMEEPDTERV